MPASVATMGPAAIEGPDAGNREHSDAGQPPQCAADDGASPAAGDGTLRRFGPLLMAKLFRADVLRKQHRNVGAPKPLRSQRINGGVRALVRWIDAKYCGVLSRHVASCDGVATSYTGLDGSRREVVANRPQAHLEVEQFINEHKPDVVVSNVPMPYGSSWICSTSFALRLRCDRNLL
jgi:hypothetical protein